MERRMATWAQQHAGTQVREVVPVAVGLGDTELWRLRRGTGEGDLLLRRFAPGGDAAARREMLAMRAAEAGGVPVPTVLAMGILEDRPALLTTWCDGRSAFEEIWATPAEAGSIGTLLGEALGRIHLVAAPDGLSLRDAWIDRGGPALGPLRSRFERIPNANRLLHLDYHPLNVIVSLGKVEGVIDWANTLAGPPHMDLARSRAILTAAAIRRSQDDEALQIMRHLEARMVEAHKRVAGPDPHPELSAAWGMAMTVDDLTAHLGKPQAW